MEKETSSGINPLVLGKVTGIWLSSGKKLKVHTLVSDNKTGGFIVWENPAFPYVNVIPAQSVVSIELSYNTPEAVRESLGLSKEEDGSNSKTTVAG